MNKKLLFFTIFLVMFLDFFNLGMIYPLFSSMIYEEGGIFFSVASSPFNQNLLFGVLVAAFPLGQFIGAPLIGQLSDQQGRRKLLILSLIGTAITLLMCAGGIYFNLLSILLIARFIGGLMAGNVTLAYASLADFSSETEKARNFALIPLSTGVGFMLGPYVSSYLVSTLSFFGGETGPFLLAIGLSLINLLCVLRFFPRLEASNKEKKPLHLFSGFIQFLKSFQNPSIRPYLWILFLMLAANFLFVQYVGPYAIEKCHLDVRQLGYLYANIGLSVALGHLFLTRNLTKYFSLETCLRSSLIVLAFLLILLIFTSSLLVIHLLTFLIMGACAVGYTTAMTLVSNQASQDQQGEIMGVAVSIQNCAEFLPALLVSFLVIFSQGLSLLTAAGCALVSFALLVPFAKKISIQ